MQHYMEMLQDLLITGTHVMCVAHVICVHLSLFALVIIVLVNAFSLPFLLTKIIPLLCQVLALYTELGVRFLDEFPLSNPDPA